MALATCWGVSCPDTISLKPVIAALVTLGDGSQKSTDPTVRMAVSIWLTCAGAAARAEAGRSVRIGVRPEATSSSCPSLPARKARNNFAPALFFAFDGIAMPSSVATQKTDLETYDGKRNHPTGNVGFCAAMLPAPHEPSDHIAVPPVANRLWAWVSVMAAVPLAKTPILFQAAIVFNV